ncbi:MAG TPA: dTDP-4-dehydrorhamnose reductase [Solirubrobacterales bacterium]|nr:dTDP-4-dehydrorhamnose reductase [Solirubrobacterales bacterium]
MKVMVTGAAGMLGREVTAACHARGHEVVALARPALDVTDPAAVDQAISRYRPDAVVNCAAYTDVDGAEENEATAMRVNDEGAALLAAAAASIDAKVLYPSSDYVFDGSTRRPYLESDIPSALSAYGRSKQAGETSVAVANPRHFIARSSWLFGLGGKNFVETMLRLGAEQSEVLVVSDQVGCPTYTRHLARALALLIEGEEFGIHHVPGGGHCSWYEFAQEIFDQAGVECRVMAATTEMLARPAPRPAYSVLGTERRDPITLPHWRLGLSAYLRKRELAGGTAAGAVA